MIQVFSYISNKDLGEGKKEIGVIVKDTTKEDGYVKEFKLKVKNDLNLGLLDNYLHRIYSDVDKGTLIFHVALLRVEINQDSNYVYFKDTTIRDSGYFGIPLTDKELWALVSNLLISIGDGYCIETAVEVVKNINRCLDELKVVDKKPYIEYINGKRYFKSNYDLGYSDVSQKS